MWDMCKTGRVGVSEKCSWWVGSTTVQKTEETEEFPYA
jgi:hypothetical protein